MSQVAINIFDTLTAAGFKPDAAHKVEREFVSAISAGQEAIREEMRGQFMSKADASTMETRLEKAIEVMGAKLEKAIDEKAWRVFRFVMLANALMLAAVRLLLH